MLQKISADAAAVDRSFAEATLAPSRETALEKEYKAAGSPDQLASAWNSYRGGAETYRSFCASLLTLKGPALADKVRETGRQLGIPNDQIEAAIPKYAQAQQALVQTGAVWREDRYVRPDGGSFNAARTNGRAAEVAPAADLSGGSRVLQCANGFDGGGCGGGSAGGNGATGFGNPRAAQARAATVTPPARSGFRPAGTALNNGATGGTPANGAAAGTPARGATAKNGAPQPPGVSGLTGGPQSALSGGSPHLDRGAVPDIQTPPAETHAAAQPSPSEAACKQAVNGPDPRNPMHSSVADLCANHSTLAPLLAGLLDSFKEAFGSGLAILMNVLFLVLGLLMSVATGGVALILKLLGLIGMSWAIFKMLTGLYSAIKQYASSKEGSVERFSALRQIGVIGGGVIIAVLMALVGFGAGKLAKAAPAGGTIKSMEAALTGVMDGVNSKIPPSVTAFLEKLLGPAPQKAPQETQKPPEKPADPRLQTASGGLDGMKPADFKAEIEAIAEKGLQTRRGLENHEVDPEEVASALKQAGELPSDPAQLQQRVAALAAKMLGVDPARIQFKPLRTDPRSGAVVLQLRAEGGTWKFFKITGDAGELTRTLFAGSTLKGFDIAAPEVEGAVRLGSKVGMLQDGAKGMSYEDIARGLGDGSLGIDKAARAAEAAADAAAKMHNAQPGPPIPRAAREAIVEKTLGNVDKLHAPDAANPLPDDVYEALRARIAETGQAFASAQTRGVVVHGDFHLGNAFYDFKTGEFSVIDDETLAEAVNRHGQGAGSAGQDVGRFVESMFINNEPKGFKLSPAQMDAFEKAFLERYLKAAGEDPKALAAEIQFYRAKLAVAALKGAKSPAEAASFVAYLRQSLGLKP